MSSGGADCKVTPRVECSVELELFAASVAVPLIHLASWLAGAAAFWVVHKTLLDMLYSLSRRQ
jgi:hypothetical protein